MSDLDVLALNDLDRAFMKAVGINVSDAAWDLTGDDEVPMSSLKVLNPDAEAEAARFLWDAWADPEAAG